MNAIDQTLAERGQRYGDFYGHAVITQNIKVSMMRSPNWVRLAADQRETLEMIAHKIGRILNGDPNYHDSWHDIVGYTKLVADRLAALQAPKDDAPKPAAQDAKSCVTPSPSEIAKRFVSPDGWNAR